MLITDEDWSDFLIIFFHIWVDKKWVKHVVHNWNARRNETDCGCTFSKFNTPMYCEDYERLHSYHADEYGDTQRNL